MLESDQSALPSSDSSNESSDVHLLDRVFRRADVIAWACVCAVVLYKLEALRAPATFFFDEWAFIFDRRSGGLDSFLNPHNGHLSLLPAIAYRIGFGIFGLDHYRPYRVGGLLVHVLVATLVYRYVKARLGALAGVSLGAVVLLLGAGWQNIFWPFQIGFMGSVAAGIGAWILLGRRTQRADLLATALLGAGLACSGLGISIVIGTAAWLAFERSWQRLVSIIGPPTALYAVWYLAYGESQGSSDNVKLLPRYVVDSAAYSVAGLGGRDLLWGRLFLGVLLGFAMIFAIHRRSLSTAVAAPAICAVSNWTLIGYSRANLGGPDASRYAYVGAVLIILVASDLLRPFRGRLQRLSIPSFAFLLVWGNWHVLHSGAAGLRDATVVTRSELRALEWSANVVDPALRPDLANMPQVFAGKYLAAVKALGSAAATDGEVLVAAEPIKAQVDRVSLEALRFALVDSPLPSDPVTDERPGDGALLEPLAGTCIVVRALPAVGSVATIAVRAGDHLTISAETEPVDVRLRRFADGFPANANGTVTPGHAMTVAVSVDTAPIQVWTVEVRSGGDVELCRP